MNFSKEEVALDHKVSVATVDRWIKNGRLKAVRFGKRVLIPQQAVDEFVREQGNLVAKR